jgi:hypothetical protein
MNTAMLFGCLFFGSWAWRGSPSASAGPPRLWQRPSARRRVACGGEVCGGGTTGTRRCGVVDFYEERRRSHRRHARSREGGPSRRRRLPDALRIAMAEMPELKAVLAAATDAPLKVKVKPPTPTLQKILAKRSETKLAAKKRALAKENDAPEKRLRGADEATGVPVVVPTLRKPLLTLAAAKGSSPDYPDDCEASNPLDCFCFKLWRQYDAARLYLQGLSFGETNGEYLLVSTTEDIYADITLNHKLISQHWPGCYEDARSAAPTPYSIYRISGKVCTRMRVLDPNGDRYKPDAKSHPLDDFCRRMAERFKTLGWTGTTDGTVAGDFACLARATREYRAPYGVFINTTPLSRLIYKGSQISIRTGSMPKWILQRFACSFARYSAEARDELELDWAAYYFGGKETLCDALLQPRIARGRLQALFKKRLEERSVVVVCVSGPDFQREFLARGKFVGAVFDGAGLDASDWSLGKDILGRAHTKRATRGYFARFAERHPVAARLYGALDEFGQIPLLKPHGSPKLLEYNQLRVPLDVHDAMASGFTSVAHGVEYGVFTVDADNVWWFHGNKDTLENIYKWPASLPLARALMEKTGLTDLSLIRLAPAKPTEIVNDGSRGKRCMPVDALTTAKDGAKRIKTKTEVKASKKLRCLNPECKSGGKEFNYRGSKDKAYLEAACGNYNCPKCGSTKFFKCVGPGW